MVILMIKNTRSPTAVDKYIGSLIRSARLSRGLTQGELASAVGVKFQQIQKYECGDTRVAASRLLMIADALDLSVVDLFGEYAGVDPGDVIPAADARKVSAIVRRIMSLDDAGRDAAVGMLDSLIKVSRQKSRRPAPRGKSPGRKSPGRKRRG